MPRAPRRPPPRPPGGRARRLPIRPVSRAISHIRDVALAGQDVLPADDRANRLGEATDHAGHLIRRPGRRHPLGVVELDQQQRQRHPGAGGRGHLVLQRPSPQDRPGIMEGRRHADGTGRRWGIAGRDRRLARPGHRRDTVDLRRRVAGGVRLRRLDHLPVRRSCSGDDRLAHELHDGRQPLGELATSSPSARGRASRTARHSTRRSASTARRPPSGRTMPTSAPARAASGASSPPGARRSSASSADQRPGHRPAQQRPLSGQLGRDALGQAVQRCRFEHRQQPGLGQLTRRGSQLVGRCIGHRPGPRAPTDRFASVPHRSSLYHAQRRRT